MPTSTRTTVFTKHCGKPAITPRADRVVRPYRTFYDFAENACNFTIAYCRVDVGIDPYGDFVWSPFIVRCWWCALRGRGKPLPLFCTYSPAKVTDASTAFLPSGLPTASRVRSAVCRR